MLFRDGIYGEPTLLTRPNIIWEQRKGYFSNNRES